MGKTMQSPRYRSIYDELREGILNGKYLPGTRMPSEVDLADTFSTSRITVARAFQELHIRGYVERRVGAGTYVRSSEAMAELRFGLLIPDLGRTEIFEPICQGMAAAQAQNARFSLLWGSSQGPHATTEMHVDKLLQHFLQVGVSGVFFAPFEISRTHHDVNRRVATALDEAGIPVILLDRDLENYPNRSKYDVVGIDNRRAGYMLAQHLLDRGCKRVAFVARPGSAPTVDERIMGVRDAVLQHGQVPKPSQIRHLNPMEGKPVSELMREIRPDAIICANDLTAMALMRTLTELSFKIPDDVLIAGFDDVKHAELLMVPLTSIRQPCAAIGSEAIAAMMERLEHPDLPARNIQLDFHLMERQSTQVPKEVIEEKQLKQTQTHARRIV